MIRINLLPHRQERRRERQRQMVTLLAMTAVVGLLVVALGHTVLSSSLEKQQGRNAFLKEQITQLDKEIEEIKRVKEETQALIARKQVVEQLQANRSEAVHILDQLLRVMPEGCYLHGIKQTGTSINLVGYAQSNARVSTLLHNLNESPWLEGGELVEIHSATVNDVRVAEFNINVKIRRVVSSGPGATPTTPPVPAAAATQAPGGTPAAAVAAAPVAAPAVAQPGNPQPGASKSALVPAQAAAALQAAKALPGAAAPSPAGGAK